jgi:hypothetical protein
MFTNKVLMITGGTGSFGNTVLKRFLSTDVREIRIFSRDEKKQEEMRIALNNPKLKFYIGDVRNYDSVYQAMKGVDYVFHAAALKQVPSCEFYPMEAVQTNVLGSENVMQAAIARGDVEYRQSGLPHQCDGHLQSDDGEIHGRQSAYAESGRDGVVRHALRQCDGLTRLSYTFVRVATQRRQADYGHRPEYDALPDVVGGLRGSGAVCIPVW